MTYTTVTPTPAVRNRVAIARVAAAGRIRAEREAREARAHARAQGAEREESEWAAWAKAAGAHTVGLKICLADGPKLRYADLTVEEAAGLIRWHRDKDDVEAWLNGVDGEPLLDHEGTPLYG